MKASPQAEVNEGALARVQEGIRGFTLSTELKELYMRNNKSGGVKHLRCFPHCVEQGHVPHGFCGSPLFADLAIKDREIAKCSFLCFSRFAPLPSSFKNPKDAETLLAIFNPVPGAIYTLSFLRDLVATRRKPALPLYESTNAIEHWDGVNSHVLFKFEPSSWNYAWRSNKHRANVRHVCRLYVFQYVHSDGTPIKRDLLCPPDGPEQEKEYAGRKQDTTKAGSYVPSQSFIRSLGSDVHIMFVCHKDSNSFKVSGCKPNNAEEVTAAHAISNADKLNRSRFIVALNNEGLALPEDCMLPKRFRTHGLKVTGEVYLGGSIVSGSDSSYVSGNNSSNSSSGSSTNANSDSNSDSSDSGNDNNNNNNNKRKMSLESSSDSDDVNKVIDGGSSSPNVNKSSADKQHNELSLPITGSIKSRRSRAKGKIRVTSSNSSDNSLSHSDGDLSKSLSTGSTGSNGEAKGSCIHGRRRYTCKKCGGKGICRHNRQRYQCKDCGGGGICKHDRIRSQCKVCGGGSICQHKRIRSVCKDCGGGSICEHKKIRSKCKNCRRAKHERKALAAAAAAGGASTMKSGNIVSSSSNSSAMSSMSGDSDGNNSVEPGTKNRGQKTSTAPKKQGAAQKRSSKASKKTADSKMKSRGTKTSSSSSSTSQTASKGARKPVNQSNFTPIPTVSSFNTADIHKAVQKKHLQLRVLTKCNCFYVRNNKRGGLKNLRCFPNCLEKGHNKNGFCGRPLNVELRITAREFRKSQFVAYGRFTTADPTGQEGNNMIKPFKTYRAIDVMNLTKTKSDNTKPLYKSNPSTDFAGKSGGAIIFRFNPTSWHYGWRSSKHMKDSAHVFRVFCFIVSSDRTLLKCIGIAETSWFTLASSKRSKTKNATANSDAEEASAASKLSDSANDLAKAFPFTSDHFDRLAKLAQPLKLNNAESMGMSMKASSIGGINSTGIQSLQNQQSILNAIHKSCNAPLSLQRNRSSNSMGDTAALTHLEQIHNLELLQFQMKQQLKEQAEALNRLEGTSLGPFVPVAPLAQNQEQSEGYLVPQEAGNSFSHLPETYAFPGAGFSGDNAGQEEAEIEVQAQLQMISAQIQQSQLRLLHAVKLNQYQELIRSRHRRAQMSLSMGSNPLNQQQIDFGGGGSSSSSSGTKRSASELVSELAGHSIYQKRKKTG